MRPLFSLRPSSLLFAAALGLGGCSCNESAVVDPDLGTPDLGSTDLGTPDLGDPDLGTGTDADMDAGSDADMDAGDVAVDLGTPDLGPADTGMDTGPAVPTCQGTPTDCTTLGNLQCNFQTGCSATGTFTSCAGTPNPCSSYTSQLACTIAGLATGCAWGGAAGCTGTPTACSMRDQNTCLEGCTAVGACTGTAAPCSTFTAQGQCTLQNGCVWQ